MDDEFHGDLIAKLIKECKTYDEFLIACDLHQIECIIQHNEYDDVRKIFIQ